MDAKERRKTRENYGGKRLRERREKGLSKEGPSKKGQLRKIYFFTKKRD